MIGPAVPAATGKPVAAVRAAAGPAAGPGRQPRSGAGLVLPLAAAALLLALAPMGAPAGGTGGGEAWELHRHRLVVEPWRLFTGHLVHWSGEHLAWDLLLFLGLGLACERLHGRRRTALALALAVPAVALGCFLLVPDLVAYRGLSGLDAALFTLLAVRCLRAPGALTRRAGAAALAALGGKILWETATGASLFLSGLPGGPEAVVVVPAAHVMGALAGLAAGWPGAGEAAGEESR